MYIRRKVFSVIEDESGVEKYFSTKELSKSDKVDLALSKLTPKKLAAEEADYYGDDEEAVKKAAKKKRKRDVIGMAASSSALGALTAPELIRKGTAKKAALIGGAAGAAVGAGVGYGMSKGTDALVKRIKDKHRKKTGKNPYEKYVDEMNVRAGRMSKEDFTDKYGKEK